MLERVKTSESKSKTEEIVERDLSFQKFQFLSSLKAKTAHFLKKYFAKQTCPVIKPILLIVGRLTQSSTLLFQKYIYIECLFDTEDSNKHADTMRHHGQILYSHPRISWRSRSGKHMHLGSLCTLKFITTL